ncbi:MAG: ABC transporter permease [Acidobacteriota bacterium]|nr:ABC transporter permease [Acidobacteriota bacterium]
MPIQTPAPPQTSTPPRHAGFWFTFREAAAIAASELRAHKMRSFLTLLGIVIATTALIVVMSVVSGLNGYIATHIADLGADTFIVSEFKWATSYVDYLKAQRRNRPIRVEEYNFLKANLPGYKEIGASAELRPQPEVKYGRQEIDEVVLSGVTPSLINIAATDISFGRYITESDETHRSMVCFIGNDLLEKFFPNIDPLGKYITIRGIPFEVVGVAKKIGTTFGQSRDNFVQIPLSTFQKLYLVQPEINIFVQAQNGAQMGPLEDEARDLLRVHRHLSYSEDDTFGINTSEALMSAWHKLTATIFGSTIGLVAVFMVIGGIVVMNIMLASVTERYHEVGIRKSLGAKRSDLLMQFCIESTILSSSGGVVGVILAVLITALVDALFIPAHTSILAVVIGLVLSGGVGLFFGIYPASKAARLDPIEALRMEG